MNTNTESKEENQTNEQTVSGHVEPVVSAVNSIYDGKLKYVTFDGVFIRKVKTKTGARRSRNQKVRIIRTTHFAH